MYRISEIRHTYRVRIGGLVGTLNPRSLSKEPSSLFFRLGDLLGFRGGEGSGLKVQGHGFFLQALGL